MKRIISVFAIGMILFITACSSNTQVDNNKVEQNNSETQIESVSENESKSALTVHVNASNIIGNNLDDVVTSFKKQGFSEIEADPLFDLSSKDAEHEKEVSTITIDGKNDFSKGDEFPLDAKVQIEYHMVKMATIPYSPGETESIAYDTLKTVFERAGFESIEYDEIKDIDPDEFSGLFKNKVTINGSTEFNKGDSIPYDMDIVVECHIPYEKYTVNVHVDFDANLLFDKYNVCVFLNGDRQSVLSHGQDKDFSFRLRPDTYSIRFECVDDISVYGSTDIQVSNNVDAAYQIKCHSTNIDVRTLYVDQKRDLLEDEVKYSLSETDFSEKNYKEVQEKFVSMGFNNIKLVPIYDMVSEGFFKSDGYIERLTVDGRTIINRGEIFSKNAEVLIEYHTLVVNDPSRIRVNKSSANFVGVNKETALIAINELGFTNVFYLEEKTQDPDHPSDSVKIVTVNNSPLSTDNSYKPDDKVIITYYTYVGPDPIKMPKSQSDYIGREYKEVHNELQGLGFKNIKLEEIEYDNTASCDGKIKNVTIGGTEFAKGDLVYPNKPVVIRCAKKIITIENDDDFACLCKAEYLDTEKQQKFIQKYAGTDQEFEFDAVVFEVFPTDSKWVCSYCLVPGSDANSIGATLFYIDRITPTEFHFDKNAHPATLYSGSKLKIRAKIVRGEDTLFVFLKPIKTWGR